MNTTAGFLSGIELDPKEKTVLKKREDIKVKPIEVNIESTGIAPEGTVFNTDDDLTGDPEQEIWQIKTGVRNTTSSQPPVTTIASYYHIELPNEP